MLEIIQEYWLTFLVGQYPHGPLGGLAMTMILAVTGLLLSLPVALALAIARVSPLQSVRVVSLGIVQTVRGIPLLMLIFWSYFVIPIVTGYSVSGFWTLIVALVIYEGAYLSEVIRSGIEAVPQGHVEASRSLGAGYMLTMRRVVLPQALFNMLPGMASQFVSTIKETSLGYVISVGELTFVTNQINYLVLTKPLQVFTISAILYFILCSSLVRCLGRIEFVMRRNRGLL